MIETHKIAPNVGLVRGEALEVLRKLPADRFHSIVTDPPAGIAFMEGSGSAEWDCFRRAKNKNDVGRDNVFGRISRTSPHSYGESSRAMFVEVMTAIFAESLRVVKPGAHGLFWALPRTAHWTAWALEDAGWEIRDAFEHLKSQGYPKSHDVAKAIEKAAGVQPIGERPPSLGMASNPQWNTLKRRLIMPETSTEDAKQWSGWDTQLKPGHETWWLVRKPFKSTVAANVLAHGTGALNVKASKVNGRWPPNYLISHAPECEPETPCVEGCAVRELDEQSGQLRSGGNPGGYLRKPSAAGFGQRAKSTSEQKPISDAGTVSRFFPVFYCPKPGRSEKEAGLSHLTPKSPEEITGRKAGSAGLVMEGGKANPYAGPSGKARANSHPTVKPVTLCRYLARLITPPEGVVLDMFAGSGSIGVGCVAEGFGYFGIERDTDAVGNSLGYIEIAKGRLAYAVANRSSS